MMQHPSTSQIIKNDTLCLSMLITMIICVLVCLVGVAEDYSQDPFGTIIVASIFGLVIIVCGVVLFGRVSKIHKLFRSGFPIQGKVTMLNFYGKDGRLTVEYDFEGKTYKQNVGIKKGMTWNGTEVGSYVDLRVDRKNPSEPLVVKLYLK